MLQKAARLALYLQGVGSATLRTDATVLRRLRRQPGPLCLFDAGANRGQYLQLALDTLRGRELRVHCFEPGRVAFAELQKQFPDVVLNNVGLSDTAREASLYSDGPGSQLASLYKRPLTGFDQSEAVQLVTLDSYCEAEAITQIDLLKLDIEGHELAALQGAQRAFKRGIIRMVSFEFGGCNIDSRTFVRDFWDFFQAQGMSLARVTPLGRIQPLPRYQEWLEQFKITCFVAQRTTSAQNSA